MGPELSFADLLAASDVVISKLGYGMVAACVANGTSLLFPTRSGFREDIALRQGAQRYLRSYEISAERFTPATGRHIYDYFLSYLPPEPLRHCLLTARTSAQE